MPATRRQFVGRAVAGLGLASSAASAQARVRAAMIGAGHGHAASKARVLREMADVDFIGVCLPDTRDHVLGEEFQRVPRVKLESILEDNSVQLVAIEGADPDWNLEYAWRAVRAGKFVHLDKPPGSNFESLRGLFEEAAARGRIVQMGYQWRYHPGMMAIHEVVRQGWLGEVYRVRASIDKPILAPERAELARYAGGMMFSEGCHLIDQATTILGEPLRVRGFLQHRSSISDGLRDNNLAVLEYPRALAEISMAGFDPHGGEHRYVEALGTNGLARVSPFAPLRLQVKLKEAAGPYKAGDQRLEPANPGGYPYRPDFDELVGVIRDGRQPHYTAAHDLMTHRVLLEVCGMLASPPKPGNSEEN
jgi:predicted dehydrogenase